MRYMHVIVRALIIAFSLSVAVFFFVGGGREGAIGAFFMAIAIIGAVEGIVAWGRTVDWS